MKKQIFTLMLGAAILTTNPLWAMDSDSEEEDNEYRLTVTQVRSLLKEENLVERASGCYENSTPQKFDIFSFTTDNKNYLIKYIGGPLPIPGGPVTNPFFMYKEVKDNNVLVFSKSKKGAELFGISLEEHALPSPCFVTNGVHKNIRNNQPGLPQYKKTIYRMVYAIYEDSSKTQIIDDSMEQQQ